MIRSTGSRALSFRALLATLVSAVLPVLIHPVEAQQSGEFVSKAKSAILMDAETGSVLFQQNADDAMPPASTSKLMTLAVLFKAIKDGKVKLEDEFTTSEYAWRTGGAPSGTAAMFIPINTKARVDEIIQGIIVQSGNDACITVAENLAGTEAAFAAQMQEEAKRIGLKNSSFRNSTGLHNPEHLMSARDLAVLARFLIREYPNYYPIFGQREFLYRKHKFYNRNPLLAAGLGVDGMKTGHTKEAGYNIVVSALSEGRRLVGVVMGLPDENARRSEASRLLEWGFRSFAKVKLFEADEQIGYARVWGGEKMYVPLSGKGELNVVLPRFPANQKLKGEIVYMGPLKPPIRKGDEVAKFRVTSSSNAQSEVPLYATEDVGPGGVARKGLDSLVYLVWRWARL